MDDWELIDGASEEQWFWVYVPTDVISAQQQVAKKTDLGWINAAGYKIHPTHYRPRPPNPE